MSGVLCRHRGGCRGSDAGDAADANRHARPAHEASVVRTRAHPGARAREDGQGRQGRTFARKPNPSWRASSRDSAPRNGSAPREPRCSSPWRASAGRAPRSPSCSSRLVAADGRFSCSPCSTSSSLGDPDMALSRSRAASASPAPMRASRCPEAFLSNTTGQAAEVDPPSLPRHAGPAADLRRIWHVARARRVARSRPRSASNRCPWRRR